GHHAPGGIHMVGANMLGDAASLAGRHPGLADVVQQGGFAVVDVAHHGHHRSAGLQVALLGTGDFLNQLLLDTVSGHWYRAVAQLGGHQHGGVLVDGLVDGGHGAHFHQLADNHGCFERHLLGQVADRDGVGDFHVVGDFFRRLFKHVFVGYSYWWKSGFETGLGTVVLHLIDQQVTGALFASLEILGFDFFLGLVVVFGIFARLLFGQPVMGLLWGLVLGYARSGGGGSSLLGLLGGAKALFLLLQGLLFLGLAAVIGSEALGLDVIHQPGAGKGCCRGGWLFSDSFLSGGIPGIIFPVDDSVIDLRRGFCLLLGLWHNGLGGLDLCRSFRHGLRS